MNRFIKIRITNSTISLEDIVNHARKAQLKKGSKYGFELDTVTKQRVYLTWFEKISTIKTVESEIFGSTSYEEIKILSFGLQFEKSASNLLLIDPPLAKHKVHSVLRKLLGAGNFLVRGIDLESSIASISKDANWDIIGLETETKTTSPKTNMSMSVTGDGNLLAYLESAYPSPPFELRSVVVQHQGLSCQDTRITLSRSGVVRLSRDVTANDIREISNAIIYQT